MKDFFHVVGRYITPYWPMTVVTFVFNILSGLFSVLSMTLMIPVLEIIFMQDNDVYALVPWTLDAKAVVNNFYFYVTQIKTTYGAGMGLLFSGVFMIIGTLLKCGTAYLASYTSVGLRNNVIRDIRTQIFQKIISLPIGFYSNERKGDVLQRATGDVIEVEASIVSSVDMFLKNPILIVVYLASMIVMSWQLTVFALVLLPVAGVLIGRVGKSLKKRSTEGQQKLGEMLGILEETISGLRIVKAFNAERRVEARYGREAQNYCNISKRLTRRRDLAHPMSEFLGTIVVIVVVWVGGTLILSGQTSLTVPTFLAYLGLFYQIINPAKAFSNAYYNIQKGMAAMERIDKILLSDGKIFENSDGLKISGLQRNIEYRDVTFSYNGEINVLRGVNLTIEKGKMIALVGQSGSGKSTFVDLLARFWDIQLGQILVDGHDVKDYRLHDLRGIMGNVSQEAILFNDTIFNNIAFGVDGATQAEVEQAARVANAHDFIVEQENGYQTVIGDRGSKLSGGQRQRISIARAILKNPDILILDEATSALDTESEKLVQDALEKIMSSRTSLVVAHRLSTIKNADMICVFHQGQIVERGTHEELINKNGYYRRLTEMQAL